MSTIRNKIRRLFTLNDTPQRIALGVGLGIFTGIFPGTGPIAALFLSAILHVNKAACVIASFATNTWLSLVTFVIAAQAGAVIWGLDWLQEYGLWGELVSKVRFLDLFKASFLRLMLPLLTGYVVVGLGLGAAAYLACLAAFTIAKACRKLSHPNNPVKSR